MRFSTLSRIVCAGIVLSATAVLAACGGGGYPVHGPTPIPTIAPTTSPTPAAVPGMLWFDLNATPAPQTFTVSETGYGGTFAGSMACTPAVSVTPPPPVAQFASGLMTDAETPSAVGGNATFTVVLAPSAVVGTCTVTVTDTNNNATTVAVNVSAAALNVFGKHRK
jgi:hypothetical protein